MVKETTMQAMITQLGELNKLFAIAASVEEHQEELVGTINKLNRAIAERQNVT